MCSVPAIHCNKVLVRDKNTGHFFLPACLSCQSQLYLTETNKLLLRQLTNERIINLKAKLEWVISNPSDTSLCETDERDLCLWLRREILWNTDGKVQYSYVSTNAHWRQHVTSQCQLHSAIQHYVSFENFQQCLAIKRFHVAV